MSFVYVGNIGDLGTEPQSGLFFLIPLASAAVKAAKQGMKAAKAKRKIAQRDVRKAQASTEAPTGESANIVALRAKLAAAVKAEAGAKARVTQTQLERRLSAVLPTTPAAPVAGVVVGNIYRPSGRFWT